MKMHLVEVAVASVLVAACGAGPPQVDTDAGAAGASAVARAMEEYVDALRTNDPVGLLALWGDDPVWIAAGTPTVRGRAEFESTVRQIFANNTVTDASATIEETAVSGDLAYQIGTYSETLAPASGEPQTIQGRFIFIWRRQPGGAWKIVRAVDAGS
jgi:uncharacterized protein (TIGR02246 family)